MLCASSVASCSEIENGSALIGQVMTAAAPLQESRLEECDGRAISLAAFSRVAEWQTQRPQKPWLNQREGSSPSLATGTGPSPWDPVLALMVKGTSWLRPKEQVQVRFLVGVLDVIASMVKGTSRGSAKSAVLVRIQVEALWPNPKGQRDPAVTRGLWVRLPPATLIRPAMLDRPGTALVRRDKWVRVPPLALEGYIVPARLSEGTEALNLGRVGSTPALAAARPRR